LKTIGCGSFSRLKDYEECPHRAFLAYVEHRRKPVTLDTTAADRGTAIHLLCEQYVRGELENAPVEISKIRDTVERFKALHPSGCIEVEQDWGYGIDWAPCGWRDEHVWLRVKCDLVNREIPGFIEVVDWKTGKIEGNEVKHAQQGQLYALATFMRYPDVNEVETLFVYVDHGKTRPRRYKRSDVPKLLPEWEQRLTRMTAATVWPAKPNKMKCRFCAYGPNNGGDNSCLWGVPL
jgi:RecB family exonuclease